MNVRNGNLGPKKMGGEGADHHLHFTDENTERLSNLFMVRTYKESGFISRAV